MATAAKSKSKQTFRYVKESQLGRGRPSKTTLIEQACQAIIAQHGALTGRLLVDAASDPAHPLHRDFEWRDNLAAIEYRVQQAEAMIRATKFITFLVDTREKDSKVLNIIAQSKGYPVRAFLPDFKGGYRGRVDVLSDADNRRLFVENKLSVLRSWCSSVIDVQELDGIRNTILSLL